MQKRLDAVLVETHRRGRLEVATAMRPGRAWLLSVAFVMLVVLVSSVVAASSVGAQHVDDEVRIVARRLASGKIEFGLQQRQEDSSWRERRLPSARLFPNSAAVNRWLVSSPLTLRITATPDGATTLVSVRIVARSLANRKVEFALQKRLADNTWSGRLLPSTRLFPTTAVVNRWLVSSPISVVTTQVAPSGDPSETQRRYTAVAAGEYQTCALRGDGSITCWGRNLLSLGEDPPDGQFTALSVGTDYACGVRADGTVTCWNLNWSGGFRDGANQPSGRFAKVSTGAEGGHSCALRTDETISCWGSNSFLQASPPGGRFIAVSAGSVSSCGVRTDGTIACWGSLGRIPRDFPDGEFTAVAVGSSNACALREDSTIACWGYGAHGMTEPPDGQFTAVTVGGTIGDHACALRTDRTIACWGLDLISQANPPDGQFTAVDAGGDHTCALRSAGTIACWGSNVSGAADPPD